MPTAPNTPMYATPPQPQPAPTELLAVITTGTPKVVSEELVRVSAEGAGRLVVTLTSNAA